MKKMGKVIGTAFIATVFLGLIFGGFAALVSYLVGKGHTILALLVVGLFLFLFLVAYIVANYDEYINDEKPTENK